MARSVALLVIPSVLLLAARPAGADERHRRRVINSVVTGGAATLDLVGVFAIQPNVAPTTCRWCNPTSADIDVRDALLWKNRDDAATLSNVVGIGFLPTLSVGLVMAGTIKATDAGFYDIVDDVLPVAESVAVGQLFSEYIKLVAGRQRPYAHFPDMANPTLQSLDDNLSFLSGHTTFAFSVVTSAGMVAHRRGYRSEPYIWGIGLPVAAMTGYFRIAADKHYLTDVMAGCALGTSVGLIVSRLAIDAPVTLAPSRDGVAVLGTF